MNFHHVAIFVSDMDQALGCYRDLLGLPVIVEGPLPDGEAPGEGVSIYRTLMDELWQYEGARSRLTLLAVGDEGSFLELQQTLEPVPEKTPRERLGYHHTGIREVAFEVERIDDWFDKVVAAGFEPQTDYVWEIVGLGRTFLFFDPDGNLVQLWEKAKAPA
jgi:catechol 2,3-dioxygenase-like lactoylglutathione lyase family enzyme